MRVCEREREGESKREKERNREREKAGGPEELLVPWEQMHPTGKQL
jgi:hypothetical protein